MHAVLYTAAGLAGAVSMAAVAVSGYALVRGALDAVTPRERRRP
jgi:hypothetical protein